MCNINMNHLILWMFSIIISSITITPENKTFIEENNAVCDIYDDKNLTSKDYTFTIFNEDKTFPSFPSAENPPCWMEWYGDESRMEHNPRVWSSLCRGEYDYLWPASLLKDDLYCWYHTGPINELKPSPYLIYSPVKAERITHWPEIVKFYDVISDDQAEIIISEAKRDLKQSKVAVPLSSKQIIEELESKRVSFNSYLTNKTKTEKKLEKLFSHITGLAIEGTAENLHVMLYNTSNSRFEPHLDGYGTADYPNMHNIMTKAGNRLATVMMFLNEVKEGGFTAFPCAGVAIRPEKGSAVIWYNMDHSGNLYGHSLHGGCPGVQGEKWIASWWIHERGPYCKVHDEKCETLPVVHTDKCPLDPEDGPSVFP